jgi:hypothetical protein
VSFVARRRRFRRLATREGDTGDAFSFVIPPHFAEVIPQVLGSLAATYLLFFSVLFLHPFLGWSRHDYPVGSAKTAFLQPCVVMPRAAIV